MPDADVLGGSVGDDAIVDSEFITGLSVAADFRKRRRIPGNEGAVLPMGRNVDVGAVYMVTPRFLGTKGSVCWRAYLEMDSGSLRHFSGAKKRRLYLRLEENNS